MIGPSAEVVAERRRGYQRRSVVGVLAFLLIASSALLPHVAVAAATALPGRALISASNFFINAHANAEGFAGANVTQLGFAINVTYLGLALHQVGVLFGLGSFWVLIAEDVGRWVRRFVLVSGVCLTLGASTVLIGYQQIEASGVHALPGIAWLPALAGGIIMLVGAHFAKKRLVSTWFWERAELAQP